MEEPHDNRRQHFLIALGAILYFAVTADIAGISISMVGLILMIAGIVGLVIGLFMLTTRRGRDTLPGDPIDRDIRPAR